MKKVIVLGGGVAGMSAAHELIERGFEVEVYDRHMTNCGGKARSVNVKKTDLVEPGMFLPGEHGFRFFPGFYKHVTDTMSRIPFKRSDGSEYTVFDNLVPTERMMMARENKKSIVGIVNFPKTLSDLKTALESFHSNTGLTEHEKSFFAERIWQLMTSCYDRRANDYERLSWWDYLKADSFSANYQALLVQGLTRTLVAANAKYASTKTGGDIFLQLIFNMINPGVQTDRVLNGPTNDVWLTPWFDYLISKGVNYHFRHTVKSLEISEGKITGAVIHNGASRQDITVTGDYYILAVPVEKASTLINKNILTTDPTLMGIIKLAPSVSWMNGAQYYLSATVNLVRGHCIFSDSQWALTAISQLQFWGDYDIQKRGNGKVKTILSVDISDWDTPGFNGKAAKDCTHDEIKLEVWKQLKESLNVAGQEILTDDMILFWHIDGDIHATPDHREINEEPLLVNTINSWSLRPEAYCAIPNLMLASDYVRTHTDLATMEGANEAARRAVNSILSDSGSTASTCEIWDLHEPLILAPFRHHDQNRYNKGLPWESYVPWWLKIIIRIVTFFKKLFTGK